MWFLSVSETERWHGVVAMRHVMRSMYTLFRPTSFDSDDDGVAQQQEHETIESVDILMTRINSLAAVKRRQSL